MADPLPEGQAMTAIAAALRDRAADAAVTLLGKPSSRTAHELRYGSNGKLSIVLTGAKAGLWHDYATGEGGDILTLAQRELGRETGLAWARDLSGMEGIPPPPRRHAPPLAIVQTDDAATKIARALALVGRARPIWGTIAEVYLATRGLHLAGVPGYLFDRESLRYVPDCWHWPSKTRLPAMVAPITNIVTGEVQAAHVTYLAADGTSKVAVDPSRLYLGPKSNGCVRLTHDAEVIHGLCIGEGIETVLTALVAGYPA